MPLIGTAGHVDHGKSTLVQHITGRDPDRWEEEKRRGLTIDLGFAWTTLPDGSEVSFVDVPGHERYLKNMLAGIEAIDAALFVVAADEGWMPQSEEHLAVLDLLGVDRGVVAVTKADSVGDDLLELACAEVAEKLEGTTLEKVPVFAVSGKTGLEVPEMLEALADQLPPAPKPNGRPRLWIDRSFTIPGAGTIVTGSLLDSGLAVGDAVVVLPTGADARIRGLQSHEQTLQIVPPGRRVAVNVAGLDHTAVGRGDMLALDGQWEPTKRFSARVRHARYVDGIEARGAYQLHIGSAALRVDIVGMEQGTVVMRMDRPLPLAVGDRFILRDTGRKVVVGGGWVVDPAPGPTRRALEAAASVPAGEDPDEAASRLVASRRLDRQSRVRAHSGGGTPHDAETIGELVVEPSLLASLESKAIALVDQEHQAHPLRPGLPMATLAERLGVDGVLTEAVVDGSSQLQRHGPDVARSEHEPRLGPKQDEQWQRARERLAAELAVPLVAELDLDPEVVHLKIRSGELIRISEELVYLPEQVDELKAHMAEAGDEFTVAQFRDAAGLSRKYAVPLLEWADKEGLTVRRGDTRRLR